MIIKADRDACIGAGTCVDTVPDVFELDEGGFVHVIERDVPSSLTEAVEDAVAICPVEALFIDTV